MASYRALVAAGILVASTLHAEGLTGLLHGFSIRVDGGLNSLSSLDGLNDGIRGMNQYFGTDGSWIQDAQGESFQFDWSPILQMPTIDNTTRMGIALERALPLSDYTRVVVGLEYSGGASSSSNLFSFSSAAGGSGGEGSLWASERVEYSNTMLTARYSLRDLNYPLHAHVGLGLGMASLTNEASYQQAATIGVQSDPSYGEVDDQQLVFADYDGDTFSGRLFAGLEWNMGPASLFLDFGYDYMDFGALDGTTTMQLRDVDGTMVNYELSGVPAGRYELVPAISATLSEVRDRMIIEAITGIPQPNDPIDVEGARGIEFDMSGGFVRFSMAYNF